MKNKNLQFLLLLVVIVSFATCPAAFCESSELDSCIAGVEKRYGSMKDIQASFKQETFLSVANRIEKAEGDVYIKKGGKMFWDYKVPSPQKIILDGQNLWVYLPDEKQVMKNTFSSVSSHIVVDLFHGRVNIKERFNVSLSKTGNEDKSKKIVLELLPKEYDPTIRRLILEIEPACSLINKTVLEDELGTRTTLIFSGFKVDKGINDSFFSFTPPPGVEVFSPPKF